MGVILPDMNPNRESQPDAKNNTHLEPFQLWAQALSSNLRRFRTTGFDAAVAAKLSKIAQDQARSINEKHGFDQQPSPPSGLKLEPLD